MRSFPVLDTWPGITDEDREVIEKISNNRLTESESIRSIIRLIITCADLRLRSSGGE